MSDNTVRPLRHLPEPLEGRSQYVQFDGHDPVDLLQAATQWATQHRGRLHLSAIGWDNMVTEDADEGCVLTMYYDLG